MVDSKLVKYIIGGKPVDLSLAGQTAIGNKIVLLNNDHNLIESTAWSNIGYTVAPFLAIDLYKQLQEGINQLIRLLVERVTQVSVVEDFDMLYYHRYVNDSQHSEIARLIQHGWNVAECPISFNFIEERISQLLGKEVSAEAKHLNPSEFRTGLTNKVYPTMYIFNLRIVRPGKIQDSNPPHRDVWIDRLRNAVNIYVPLCGSTSNSSLPLIDGSHQFFESDIERTLAGAYLNDTKYSVPCVTAVKGATPELQRPNPNENEVLLFSPYLIHGGGYNFENDTTRISLEARFWAI